VQGRMASASMGKVKTIQQDNPGLYRRPKHSARGADQGRAKSAMTCAISGHRFRGWFGWAGKAGQSKKRSERPDQALFCRGDVLVAVRDDAGRAADAPLVQAAGP
jgi:hypothetical protein